MRIYGRTQGQVCAAVSEVITVARGKTNDDELEPARVCIFCGSSRPEELLQQCAHGLVATVQGNERKVAARLHVAFQALHAQRAAMMVSLDAAVARGAASIDKAPSIAFAGDNLIPMYERDVIGGEVG